MKEVEFEIDRKAVWWYFLTGAIFCTILFLILLCMLGSTHFSDPNTAAFGWLIIITAVFVACVVIFIISPLFIRKHVNNLRYGLEGNILRVYRGVFFLMYKSIPIERITDVALVQGPLLRFFGIWEMRIQTAGSPQCEATLYGVHEPEKIRELILSQRQSVYGEKAGDA